MDQGRDDQVGLCLCRSRRLRAVEPVSAAREVFRGKTTDVGGHPLSSPSRTAAPPRCSSSATSISSIPKHNLIVDGAAKLLALPTRSTIHGYVNGRLIVSLEADWPAKKLKEGDLIDFDLAAVKRDPAHLAPALILRPSQSQSVEQVATTRNRLVVAMLDNVKGQVVSFARTAAPNGPPPNSTCRPIPAFRSPRPPTATIG